MMINLPGKAAGQTSNYTISFKDNGNSSDGSEITSYSSLSDILSGGTSYVTSISDFLKVYKGKQDYGWKLGSSSALGHFTMTLSNDGKVNATSIVFNSCRWVNSNNVADNSSLKVTITDTDDNEYTQTFTLTASLADYTYTFESATEIASIKIEGVTKRIYVKSVTVNYSTGTPTPSMSIPAEELALANTANDNGLFNVSYENYTPVVAIAGLYSNEECTEDFPTSGDGAWIILAENMTDYYTKQYYSVDANPTATLRTVYLQIIAEDANSVELEEVFTITQAAAPTYTVTYDCNGGTSGCPDNVSGLLNNTNINLAAAPTKTGYTFSGWKTGETTYNAGAQYTVIGNVTFTAQWTIETYTITYKPGYEGPADITETKTYNVAYTIASNTFAGETGHTFTGWKDGDNKDYAPGDQYTTNAPLTLTAQWTTATMYTVQFDCNGGESGCPTASQIVAENTVITIPDAPTREGYTFNTAGWYCYKDYGWYSPGSPYQVTGNVTFEARWIENVANPTFSPAAGTVVTGTSIAISCVTTGATIQYSTDNGTTWNNYSAPIALTANTTLKAKATKSNCVDSEVTSATYTVVTPKTVAEAHQYIANGGDESADNYIKGIISTVGSYNGKYNSITYWISDDGTTSNQLQAYGGISGIDGYTFSAANNLAVGDVVLIKGKLINYNTNTHEIGTNNELKVLVRLTADDVEIGKDDTSGEIEYELYTLGSVGNLAVSDNVDWISDVTLAGNNTITFNTTANEGAAREGTITVSCGAMASFNVKVTQAGLPTYTVTYAAGTGTGTMTDENSPYLAGTEVTLLANTFTAPSGKVWSSWLVKDADNGEVDVNNGKFTMPAKNVTVTAQWVDDPNAPVYAWVKTDISGLYPGDEFVIVGTFTYSNTEYNYAMTNNETNSPLVSAVAISNNKLSTDPAANIQWNVSGNAVDGYTFYPNGDDEKWLNYNTTSGSSNNDKLRVGIGDRKVFDFEEHGYMKTKDTYSTRYLSIYSNSTPTDWRGYLNKNNNPVVISFYKKVITNNNFNGTTDNKWNVATNWSLGVVPTTDYAVTINAACEIPANYTAQANSVTLGNSGSITIAETGQLVCSNSVEVTMEKAITAYSDELKKDWYTLSTPVHTGNNNYVAFDDIDEITYNLYNVYYFDEENTMWINSQNDVTGYDTLNNGWGYIYRNSGDVTLKFSGNSNFDSVDYTLSYTPANTLAGFNLIGNPYTHNIYKGSNAAAIPNGGLLEEDAYALDTDGTWNLLEDGNAIAPMQAVLVQAKEQTGDDPDYTLTMYNTTGGATGGGKYANDNIWFIVKNAKYTDKTCVKFKKGHGLNKIEHRNDQAPMLYIINNGEKFGVADMPDNTKVINLGFEAKTMGQYTISLKAEGQYSYMHLIDKLTSEDVDMLAEDSYTFVGLQSDRKDRFVLNLNYNAASIDTESDIFAYQNGSDIIVNGEGELQIFDVMGRMIATRRINGVETINVPTNGVYIFRLNEKAQKIVVE